MTTKILENKKEIITDSVAKMKDWMCPDTPNWMPQEVSTGTTLVAMEFADGVVLGADTRWGRKSIFNYSKSITYVLSSIVEANAGLLFVRFASTHRLRKCRKLSFSA